MSRQNLILLPVLAALVAPAVALGAPAEGNETPFAGTIYQALAALIVFSLTVVILRKFAWSPILQGLEDRENKIRNDVEQAELAAKQATATLEDYRAKLAAAQDEARKMIDQSKKEAQIVADQIKKQAEEEITLMKTRAQAEIGSAKEQALAEVYAQTATEVASKILQRNLNPDDQKRLVEESLAAIKQYGNN